MGLMDSFRGKKNDEKSSVSAMQVKYYVEPDRKRKDDRPSLPKPISDKMLVQNKAPLREEVPNLADRQPENPPTERERMDVKRPEQYFLHPGEEKSAKQTLFHGSREYRPPFLVERNNGKDISPLERDPPANGKDLPPFQMDPPQIERPIQGRGLARPKLPQPEGVHNQAGRQPENPPHTEKTTHVERPPPSRKERASQAESQMSGKSSPVSTNKSRRSSLSQSTDLRHSTSLSESSTEIVRSVSRNGTPQSVEVQVTSPQYGDDFGTNRYQQSPVNLDLEPTQGLLGSVRSSSRNAKRQNADGRVPNKRRFGESDQDSASKNVRPQGRQSPEGLINRQKAPSPNQGQAKPPRSNLGCEKRQNAEGQTPKTQLRASPSQAMFRTQHSRNVPSDSTERSTSRQGSSQDQGLPGTARSSSRSDNRQDRRKTTNTQPKEDLVRDVSNGIDELLSDPQPQQQQSQPSKQRQQRQPTKQLQPIKQQETDHQPQPSNQQSHSPSLQTQRLSKTQSSQPVKQSLPVKQQSLPNRANSLETTNTKHQSRTNSAPAQMSSDIESVRAALAQALKDLENKTCLLEQAEEERTKLKIEVEMVKEAAAVKEQDLMSKSTELEEDLKQQLTRAKKRKEAIEENCIIKHGSVKVWEELEQAKLKLAAVQAEHGAALEELKKQYTSKMEKMQKSYQDHLEAEFQEVENEHQEQVDQLQDEISQLENQNATIKEESFAEIERLQAEHRKELADRDNALEQERNQYEEDRSAREIFIGKVRQDEQKKHKAEVAGLQDAYSILEKRLSNAKAQTKDLQTRLAESLQARMEVIDDREEHIDSVTKLLNTAFAQLQKGKSKDLAEEKKKLNAELTILLKASESTATVEDNAIEQKATRTKNVRIDSGQPTPESEVPVTRSRGRLNEFS
jgi:hypothetical protein